MERAKINLNIASLALLRSLMKMKNDSHCVRFQAGKNEGKVELLSLFGFSISSCLFAVLH